MGDTGHAAKTLRSGDLGFKSVFEIAGASQGSYLRRTYARGWTHTHDFPQPEKGPTSSNTNAKCTDERH